MHWRDKARPVGLGLIERWPALFCLYQEKRFPDRKTVTRRTALVMEGYPSAGNTFAREAFLVSNPGVEVASHLHSLAPLKLALARGLPAVVLLRTPLDSVVSVMSRFDFPDAGAEFRRYVGFYRGVSQFRDYAVFSSFEQTTTGFGQVVRRVNSKFGTAFQPFADESEDDQAVVRAIIDGYSQVVFGTEGERRRARPSEERSVRASALRQAVIDEVGTTAIEEAESLHAQALAWTAD